VSDVPSQPDRHTAFTAWIDSMRADPRYDASSPAAFAAGWDAATRAERERTTEHVVREFYNGCKPIIGEPSAALWLKLVGEEFTELADAMLAEDRTMIADACADLVYATIGIAVALGIPFDAVFAEVHRSNMTKLLPPVALRDDGKIVKGPRFEPPRIADLLGGDTHQHDPPQTP